MSDFTALFLMPAFIVIGVFFFFLLSEAQISGVKVRETKQAGRGGGSECVRGKGKDRASSICREEENQDLATYGTSWRFHEHFFGFSEVSSLSCF